MYVCKMHTLLDGVALGQSETVETGQVRPYTFMSIHFISIVYVIGLGKMVTSGRN